MTNPNTAAIESLRTFALAHNESGRSTQRRHVGVHAFEAADRDHLAAFAHLCSAALNGEQWAVERLADVLELFDAYMLNNSDYDTAQAKLDVILATDTTRPDGLIARSLTCV